MPVTDSSMALEIVEKLLLSHRTWLAWYGLDGKIYARLSANVYNELNDYVDMAKNFLVIMQIVQDRHEGLTTCVIQ